MKNKVIVREGYIEIALEGKHGTGKFTKVDSDDYMKLELWKYRWLGTDNNYVTARDPVNKKPIRLHRFVLGLGEGDPRWGDHIYHDTLDNRKSELRVAAPAENGRNRRRNSNHDLYKGVSEHKASGKLRAQLRLKDGHKFHISLFDKDKAVEAAYCVDVACSIEHGDFAYINEVSHLISDERKKEIEELAHNKLAKHYGKKKVITKPTSAANYLISKEDIIIHG